MNFGFPVRPDHATPTRFVQGQPVPLHFQPMPDAQASQLPGVDPTPSAADQAMADAVPDQVQAYNPQQFARITDLAGQTLPASTSQASLVVPESSTRRNFLAIRNPQASGGVNVLVGFGSAPNAYATIRVTPGQVIIFDAVVPQDDVWVLSDGAAGLVSVAFSNMPAA